ncbi:YciI family protein [Demequina rhizosphaerae]|uniref:YciI family protein n=1 Tax=Demequina rhizosphaerae TaxID=1638985 RepID=UPI0007847314|nr:YciI family protein [Demequina rhizosphaerae]
MSLFAIHYVYDDRAAERDEMRPVHRAWMLGLAERGIAKVFGRYEDEGEPGALLVFEAESAEAVEGFLAADPYQEAGLVVSHSIRAWPAGGPWTA